MKFTSATILPPLALLLFLVSCCQANVVVFFEDSGNDISVTMTGTIDLTETPNTNSLNDDRDRMLYQSGAINVFYSTDGPVYSAIGAGNFSTGTFSAAGYEVSPADSNATGRAFGFSGTRIMWDQAYTDKPGVITVDRRFTIFGRSVAGQFGSLLDGGPVTVWTHTESGDTISFVAVPEPTSALMVGLCVIAGGFIRRRSLYSCLSSICK